MVTRAHVRMALVVAALLATPTWAEGDLQVELEAFRVVAAEDGSEALEPTQAARPGEVLEYRVTYANHGGGTLRGIRGVLPIPEATVYLPESAAPVSPEGSTDGEHFASMPLRRPSAEGDGRTELVPASEIRFLRWTLGDLEPGADISARVRLSIPTRTAAAEAR